jgi:hypothetical protein
MNRLIAVLIVSIGLGGCNNSAAPSTIPPQKQFTIVDIKGDVLGMSYADYKKKHPGDCDDYLHPRQLMLICRPAALPISFMASF